MGVSDLQHRLVEASCNSGMVIRIPLSTWKEHWKGQSALFLPLFQHNEGTLYKKSGCTSECLSVLYDAED